MARYGIKQAFLTVCRNDINKELWGKYKQKGLPWNRWILKSGNTHVSWTKAWILARALICRLQWLEGKKKKKRFDLRRQPKDTRTGKFSQSSGNLCLEEGLETQKENPFNHTQKYSYMGPPESLRWSRISEWHPPGTHIPSPPKKKVLISSLKIWKQEWTVSKWSNSRAQT